MVIAPTRRWNFILLIDKQNLHAAILMQRVFSAILSTT
jgi:hypothetical protein